MAEPIYEFNWTHHRVSNKGSLHRNGIKFATYFKNEHNYWTLRVWLPIGPYNFHQDHLASQELAIKEIENCITGWFQEFDVTNILFGEEVI